MANKVFVSDHDRALVTIAQTAPTPGLTAAERLQLLLPWLNGKVLDTVLVRERLYQFLHPWADFEAEAEGLKPPGRTHTVNVNLRELFRRRPSKTPDLKALRADLLVLLDGGEPQTFPTLTFTVYRRSDGERHIALNGAVADVVRYEVMRLLTDPGMVTLARCVAPGAGKRRCGHWLVAHGRRRGRTAIYCSRYCRYRAWKANNDTDKKPGRLRPAKAARH